MQGTVLVLYKVANKNKLLPYNQNSHNCIIHMYMYVHVCTMAITGTCTCSWHMAIGATEVMMTSALS